MQVVSAVVSESATAPVYNLSPPGEMLEPRSPEPGPPAALRLQARYARGLRCLKAGHAGSKQWESGPEPGLCKCDSDQVDVFWQKTNRRHDRVAIRISTCIISQSLHWLNFPFSYVAESARLLVRKRRASLVSAKRVAAILMNGANHY